MMMMHHHHKKCFYIAELAFNPNPPAHPRFNNCIN